ncbi:MAG: hypothetical protein HY053_08495 [Proteobacteria bacterium]|nr:hypothetical protein [Pseudomonadota bacterium]
MIRAIPALLLRHNLLNLLAHSLISLRRKMFAVIPSAERYGPLLAMGATALVAGIAAAIAAHLVRAETPTSAKPRPVAVVTPKQTPAKKVPAHRTVGWSNPLTASPPMGVSF